MFLQNNEMNVQVSFDYHFTRWSILGIKELWKYAFKLVNILKRSALYKLEDTKMHTNTPQKTVKYHKSNQIFSHYIMLFTNIGTVSLYFFHSSLTNHLWCFTAMNIQFG